MYEHANTYMRVTYNTVESRINEIRVQEAHVNAVTECAKLCAENYDISMKEIVRKKHNVLRLRLCCMI